MTQQQPDWDDRVAAALWVAAAGLSAALAAFAGSPRLLDWEPRPVLIAGAVCAVATAVPAARQQRWGALLLRIGSWSAAAGWVAWTYAHTAWSSQAWQYFAFGLVAFVVLAPWFPVPNNVHIKLHHNGPVPALPPPTPAEWPARLERVARVQGARVLDGPQAWPRRTGYDVLMQMPDDGTDWQDMQPAGRKLASNLQLPAGCGVEVAPGPRACDVLFRVATVDALAEDQAYDLRNITPLTINAPIPFGRHRDDTPAEAEMRQRCAMLIGEIGSGKTNVLENINAGLVRCPDVFLCHIDLNGGGMPLQWLAPWMAGDAARPAVGWVATTVEEAIVMTDWILAVCLGRKTAYSGLMRQQNTRLLPVSHDIPAIILVVDEGAEATGLMAAPRLQRNITRIVELLRAMAGRLVYCGLRATSDIIPAQARVQLGIRVAMRVTDSREAHELFGWKVQLNQADTPHVGSGWWRDGGSGPLQVFRSPHADPPETIAAIARACSDWRPDMDEVSLRLPPAELQKAFATRWDRVVPLLTSDGRADGATPPVRHPDATPPATPRGGLDLSHVKRRIADARLLQMPANVVEQRWADLAGQLKGEPAAEVVEESGPVDTLPPRPAVDPRTRALQVLEEAGPEGASGPSVLARLAGEFDRPPAQSTLYDWLKRDAVDGGYGKYVHPKFREAA